MKIFNSRLFKVLIVLFIFGFLLGIVSFIVIKDNSGIINYFESLKNNDYISFSSFISLLISNYKYAFIIWILGILFFLSIITPFIIIFRGILVGFTISSIIYSFHIKGLLYAFIMLFPCTIINELVFILLSFYSINFSFKLFNIFKNNKFINIRSFTKNYFYIFLILLVTLLLSSLFETYITSNIIRFMI